MEEADMIPDEIIDNFVKWSVDEVYDRWQLFALNASIAAYDFAIKKSREESDARTAQMKEFIEDVVKGYDREVEKSSKGFRIYTPVKPAKDMR
ncbi:hypothetical protein ES705_51162 [subsurface metagenome]